MPRALVAVVAALAVGVAACGPGAPSRALDNTSWVLTSIGGTDVSLDAPPTLTFSTGGQFDGYAGCNDFFGEAEIYEGTIKVTTIGATARGCDDPAALPVEMAYLDALQHMSGWSVDGDLLTLTGSTELTLSGG